MKIRNGFVSNSSSSSFLIGLTNKPKTRGELRDLMFAEEEGDVSVYDYSMGIDEVVCRVFNDLEKEKPLTENQILEVIRSGWFDGCPQWSSKDNEKSDAIAAEFLKIYNDARVPEARRATSFFDDMFRTHPLYPEYRRKWDAAYEAESKRTRDRVEKAVRKFFNSVKHRFIGKQVFRLEFSDNGGEVVLEHGNIFRRLPHVVISNH